MVRHPQRAAGSTQMQARATHTLRTRAGCVACCVLYVAAHAEIAVCVLYERRCLRAYPRGDANRIRPSAMCIGCTFACWTHAVWLPGGRRSAERAADASALEPHLTCRASRQQSRSTHAARPPPSGTRECALRHRRRPWRASPSWSRAAARCWPSTALPGIGSVRVCKARQLRAKYAQVH